MPTQLAKLYRFLRHEDTEDLNPVWNVASVPYDMNYRLYRIMYSDSENENLNCDYEVIISTSKSWKKELKAFIETVINILGHTGYSHNFHRACMDLVYEDPWLEEYLSEICKMITKILPSPCT